MNSNKIKTTLYDRRSFLAGGAAITGVALTGAISPARSHTTETASDFFSVVNLEEKDLQSAIDEAADHSILVCRSEHPITVNETIVIRKPLTLVGLRAQLPEGLAGTEILSVEAEHVAIEDFELKGNADSVDQQERASLIRIMADHFRVENGLVTDSSKHGIVIRSMGVGDRNHGVVRNIVGRQVQRDVVSMTGYGDFDRFVCNILIENIWAHGPSRRGAVEAADGTRNITIRNIYAESCAYGIDVEDHNRRGQKNENVTIDGVYVTNCPSAVITSNRPFGHRNLTIRNVTGENWPDELRGNFKRLSVRNTANVVLENVRINGNSNGEDIELSNCTCLTMCNLVMENSDHEEPSVVISNSDNTRVDGAMLINASDKLRTVLKFKITEEQKKNLQITNVSGPDLENGIVITRSNTDVTLKNYIINNNLTGVMDHIKGKTALVSNNQS